MPEANLPRALARAGGGDETRAVLDWLSHGAAPAMTRGRD
jgi:hypothetical protein